MKLLIIEDQSNHIADARTYFAKNQPEIEITIISQLAGVLENMLNEIFENEKFKFDGVITDVFFPYELKGKYSNPEPIGVSICMAMQAAKIPCVVCTAGNHHGVKYQWIDALSSTGMGPLYIVDNSDVGDGEANNKNWEGAFKVLIDKAIPFSKK